MPTTTTQTSPTGSTAAAKRDFRQEVTDRIVEMLEKGVAPWQKPWNPGEALAGMPFNPTTERAYRGGNAIHLMATSLNGGYGDPRWMTYKQAADRGWQVRRGEKRTQIEFWDVKPARDEEAASSEADERKRGNKTEARLIHRVYTVFNAKQIEGIPQYQPRQRNPIEVVQSGESILEHSGADIRHDQADRAFYSRTSDTIHLPPKDAFKDATGYYGTALHELSHWSGHPLRLNRVTLNESYRFGDANYAKEELRAELASVFLAAERGIPHDPAQHAAYVGSWIKTLREDKNEIFRAAHDASLASDFLLSLERDRSIANEELAAGRILDSTTNPRALETAYEQESSNLQRDREDLTDEPIPQEAAPGNRTTEPLLKQVAALTWKTDGTLASESLINALGIVNDAGGRFLIYQNTYLSAPDAIKAHKEFTDRVHALQNEPLSSLDKRDAAYRAGYSFSTLLSALVLSSNPEAFSLLDSAEPLLSSEPVRSSFLEGFAQNRRNRYTEDDERFPGSPESRQRADEREQFIQAMQQKLGCEFENPRITVRLEPDSGTVKVEEKQTGTQHRNPIEIDGASASTQNQPRDRNDELNAAHAITINALGQSAGAVDALVEAGTYRGVVLGETERYLVQRQSAGMAVLHQKDLLDRQPQVGEVFSINYSNGRGVVQEFRERARSNALGR